MSGAIVAAAAGRPGDIVEVIGVPTPVAAAVRRVYDDCAGVDLAARLLAAAEQGDPDLRGYFEWNDDRAADAWRLRQAEALVRRVKVRVLRQDEPEPIVVRAYVAVRDVTAAAAGVPPGTYLAIEDVAGATDREALLEAIRKDLRRLQVKYKHVSEYFHEALEEVLSVED